MSQAYSRAEHKHKVPRVYARLVLRQTLYQMKRDWEEVDTLALRPKETIQEVWIFSGKRRLSPPSPSNKYVGAYAPLALYATWRSHAADLVII